MWREKNPTKTQSTVYCVDATVSEVEICSEIIMHEHIIVYILRIFVCICSCLFPLVPSSPVRNRWYKNQHHIALDVWKYREWLSLPRILYSGKQAAILNAIDSPRKKKKKQNKYLDLKL